MVRKSCSTLEWTLASLARNQFETGVAASLLMTAALLLAATCLLSLSFPAAPLPASTTATADTTTYEVRGIGLTSHMFILRSGVGLDELKSMVRMAYGRTVDLACRDADGDFIQVRADADLADCHDGRDDAGRDDAGRDDAGHGTEAVQLVATVRGLAPEDIEAGGRGGAIGQDGRDTKGGSNGNGTDRGTAAAAGVRRLHPPHPTPTLHAAAAASTTLHLHRTTPCGLARHPRRRPRRAAPLSA